MSAMKPSGHLSFYRPYVVDILTHGDSKQRTSDICFRINLRLPEEKRQYFLLKTEKCRRILLGLAEIGLVRKAKGLNKNEFYWELS
jgi:hypothetical protein